MEVVGAVGAMEVGAVGAMEEVGVVGAMEVVGVVGAMEVVVVVVGAMEEVEEVGAEHYPVVSLPVACPIARTSWSLLPLRAPPPFVLLPFPSRSPSSLRRGGQRKRERIYVVAHVPI